VDFPIENGDFPVRYVNVYQRVTAFTRISSEFHGHFMETMMARHGKALPGLPLVLPRGVLRGDSDVAGFGATAPEDFGREIQPKNGGFMWSFM
jgi:hypothetical protein